MSIECVVFEVAEEALFALGTVVAVVALAVEDIVDADEIDVLLFAVDSVAVLFDVGVAVVAVTKTHSNTVKNDGIKYKSSMGKEVKDPANRKRWEGNEKESAAAAAAVATAVDGSIRLDVG
ncbi:hypothetical protein HYFRA_00006745 [Hymenoscyphus fraxineus]|uniref:Uncharacterized protein n=1 Tax=Hymenoscyphus fraxineus TaxID=746836 RepID=A0A9N9KXM0_9HELO|nr:hypothetical protein HYFRA_00006745 [Hymenoscyphus fraxineus]